MYLVSWGDCRKIVTATVETLNQEIEKKFENTLQGHSLQRYCPDFDDWCDLSEGDDIPSMSQIRVVKSKDADDKPTSSALNASSGTVVKLPSLGLSKHSKSIQRPRPKDTDRLVRESSSSEISSSNRSGRASGSSSVWPLVYSLPSFSADVQRFLQCYQGGPLVPRIRKRILETLFVDLSQYGMYPGNARYNQVCYTLVRKYPQLCDTHVLPGRCNYTNWLMPLKSKFKEARRKMEKTGYLRDMQEKYGHTKRLCEEDEGNSEVCKKRRLKIVKKKDICLVDKSIVTKHKLFMRNEVIKKKPDFVAIEDRMGRTFGARRVMVNDEKSVADTLDEYPALKVAQMVNKEMVRIAAVDLLTSVRDIKEEMFMRLLQWRAVPRKINSLIDENQCTILAAIPSAFRENWMTFLLIDEEANTPYPVLIYKSETKLFEVHVEGCVIRGAQDFLEGVATLLSTYWVFDLRFPKSSKKTFGFIAETLIGLPRAAIPGSVSTTFFTSKQRSISEETTTTITKAFERNVAESVAQSSKTSTGSAEQTKLVRKECTMVETSTQTEPVTTEPSEQISLVIKEEVSETTSSLALTDRLDVIPNGEDELELTKDEERQARLTLEDIFSVEDDVSNTKEQNLDEAHDVTKEQTEPSSLSVVKCLHRCYQALVKAEAFAEISNVVQTLFNLVQRQIQITAEDVETFATKLRSEKKFIDAHLFFQIASKFHELDPNPNRVVDGILECVKEMCFTQNEQIESEENFRPFITKCGIPVMHDLLRKIQSTRRVEIKHRFLQEARCFHFIYLSYSTVEDWESCESTVKQGISLMRYVFVEDAVKYQVYGRFLNSLGVIYHVSAKLDEALKYYQLALDAHKKAEDYEDEEEKTKCMSIMEQNIVAIRKQRDNECL